MSDVDIKKILDDMGSNIDSMVQTSYYEMVQLILKQELSPQEAQKRIKDALATVNEKSAELMAIGLSKSLNRSFSAEYVNNFKVGGIKISRRLYNNSKDVADASMRVINDGLKQNKTIEEISKLLYEGYDFKIDPLNVKRKSTIPKWLKDELNKPPSQRSFYQVSNIKTPALKAAYNEALKTKSFNMQDKALKRAFYEKSRYYSNRIAQNEVMKSYSIERAKLIAEDDDVEVVKVRMSRTHKRVDICDYHSKVNKFGLGAGVYPKHEAPIAPFHPYCRCILVDYSSKSAKGAKFDKSADKKLMDSFNSYERRLIVGSQRRLNSFEKSKSVMGSAYLGSPLYVSDVSRVSVYLGYNGGM